MNAAPPFDVSVQLDRSCSIGSQIYVMLRRAITTCRLKPGDAITEASLTERLGVSRTPLRQALHRLADDGLVVIRPQAGTFVSGIDRQGWQEGRLIRRALEVEGVKLAAARVTDSALDELAHLLSRQRRIARQGPHEEFFTLDDAFHAAISGLSGFPKLWRTIDGAKAQLDRTRYLAIPKLRRAAVTVTEHVAVLEALTARDGEAAAFLLGQHLDKSDLAIERLFASGLCEWS
jgi:DNA-binding GntR family transcriptional regulator